MLCRSWPRSGERSWLQLLKSPWTDRYRLDVQILGTHLIDSLPLFRGKCKYIQHNTIQYKCIYLFMYLCIYLFIYLFIYLSIYLFIIYLLVYLFIYLFI